MKLRGKTHDFSHGSMAMKLTNLDCGVEQLGSSAGSYPEGRGFESLPR